MNPSLYEIYQSLSLTMSITLVLFELQNLLVVVPLDSSGFLIQRQTLSSILGVGAVIFPYAVYRIPAPLLAHCGVEGPGLDKDEFVFDFLGGENNDRFEISHRKV